MSVEELLDRQTAYRDAIRDKVQTTTDAAWNGLGSWNDSDVETFASRVVPVVEAGQMQTAAITDVYLSSTLTEMGLDSAPVGMDAAEVTALRPVPPGEVYRRPFVDTWTSLKNGAEFQVALNVGASRLKGLVEDDLSLAHRHAVVASLSGRPDIVTGYRRVIRPESKTGTCGLCVAAASQRYSTEHLLPIHTHCHCDVLPILKFPGSRSTVDPGAKFNDEDILALYEKGSSLSSASGASGTAAADLKEVRFRVDEHGELGPTLSRAGDNFAHVDHYPTPKTVRPVAKPVAPAPVAKPVVPLSEMSADQLESAMNAAIEVEDFERLDEVSAALDDLEVSTKAATAKAAKTAERKVAAEAAKDVQLEALLGKGYTYEEAFAESRGISIEPMRRDDAISMLRAEGHTGAGFDEITRNAFVRELNSAWVDAENATNGYMVRKEFLNQVPYPEKLWQVNEATARKWATPELLEYWDLHGRITLEEFRANLVDPKAAAALRAQRGDFYA